LGNTAIDALGNTENNSLYGNSANNQLNGWTGADLMAGGQGNDTYIVDNTGDFIWENANEGLDTVYADVSYALTANVEQLFLMGSTAIDASGNTENNLLVGNTGNNQLNGWAGVDTMIGGAGNDTYIVDNSSDFIWENSGEGMDTIFSEVSYGLANNIENLYLTGTAIDAVGNTENNLLVGNSLGNTLNGLGGADTMIGGAGNDAYIVDNGSDFVWENVGEGTADTVYSSVSYWLTSNVEQLTLTGTLATEGVGNTLNNTLIGNDANNALNGGIGADVLIGGKGDDAYIVDNSSDFIWENAGDGVDTVYSSVSFALTANLEALVLTGTALDGTGNNENNYLLGNNSNNTLIGWTGSDTLVGGEGKDIYNLAEPTAATDIVHIAAGDSLISSYDLVTSFGLGTGFGSTVGVDILNLSGTLIASDSVGVDGIDSGNILSHNISNGIISFDDINNYTSPVTINSATNLPNVLNYLQNNITGFNTVAFVSEGNTFVFQDGGVLDTLVELVGVTTTSLSNTGLVANSVWIV
jgi:Ca2+-binding RTX toxin-like protein